MPYRTAGEMPDAAKRLPAHAGRIWRNAFNACHQAHPGDESRCFGTAWGAVKNAGYGQDQRGRWVKTGRGQSAGGGG